MRKLIVFIILNILILSFSSTFSFPATKPAIVVSDLDAHGVSGTTALTISEKLRTKLIETKRFNVIERKRMEEILEQQKLSITGCTDTECIIRLGKFLNANKIIVGSLSRLGRIYTIDVRFIDVESGIADFSVDVSRDCQVEEEVFSLVAELAKKVANKIPLTGKITEISPEGIHIDLGSEDGIEEGIEFDVFRRRTKEDKSSEIIISEKDKIGLIRLVIVDRKTSIAKIINKKEEFHPEDLINISSKEQKKLAKKQIVKEEKKQWRPATEQEIDNIYSWQKGIGLYYYKENSFTNSTKGVKCVMESPGIGGFSFYVASKGSMVDLEDEVESKMNGTFQSLPAHSGREAFRIIGFDFGVDRPLLRFSQRNVISVRLAVGVNAVKIITSEGYYTPEIEEFGDECIGIAYNYPFYGQIFLSYSLSLKKNLSLRVELGYGYTTMIQLYTTKYIHYAGGPYYPFTDKAYKSIGGSKSSFAIGIFF